MNLSLILRRARRVIAPSAIALIAIALVIAPLIPSPALARRPTERRAPAATPAPAQALTAPYAATCVMEPVTGQILADSDMHKSWPTASLTKMMLMLIVAQKLADGSLKLTDNITTSRLAAQMGGSQVYLKEGEVVPLDDMMKAIVVHSANDASVAIAEYVAGSTDAFVQMMNREAKRLGMNDTHYYSVHGLPPAAGQQADVSSAYDLAVLARALVKYPDVLRWSAIDTAPFRNGTFQLRNTNHLVRTYPGCDGLKTGFYDKAGFNVVATARRNGLRLIAVVLGSPRKNENFSEAATLLSQGFLNYDMKTVAKKGSAIGQVVTVRGGSTSSIRPVWSRDVSVLLKRDDAKTAYKISYQIPPAVDAPIKAGQPIGTGVVIVDGKAQVNAPVVAAQDVARGSLLRQLLGRL
jgi:serine-type D-Ala-D-Ala carboxypeptidase (penicillin-binding protein 5/6)